MRRFSIGLLVAAMCTSLFCGSASAENKYKASFSVIARQKLPSVEVQASSFVSLNMKQTVTAQKGSHLELLRVKADVEWKENTSSVYTDMELSYPGEKEAIECAGCAYRNKLGVFESDNSFQFVVRDPSMKGITKASETRDFVFFVPDDAKDLALTVTESSTEKEHKLALPAEFSVKLDVPSIKINVSAVSNEYAASIKTVSSVSYSPKVDKDINWTLTDGYYLLVKAKVQPDAGMDPSVRNVTLEPCHFSLKLPDGKLIKAIGSITEYGDKELHSGTYTHNFGRNQDGTWPEGDETFVFIVGGKLKDFELVFLPR